MAAWTECGVSERASLRSRLKGAVTHLRTHESTGAPGPFPAAAHRVTSPVPVQGSPCTTILSRFCILTHPAPTIPLHDCRDQFPFLQQVFFFPIDILVTYGCIKNYHKTQWLKITHLLSQFLWGRDLCVASCDPLSHRLQSRCHRGWVPSGGSAGAGFPRSSRQAWQDSVPRGCWAEAFLIQDPRCVLGPRSPSLCHLHAAGRPRRRESLQGAGLEVVASFLP